MLKSTFTFGACKSNVIVSSNYIVKPKPWSIETRVPIALAEKFRNVLTNANVEDDEDVHLEDL